MPVISFASIKGGVGKSTLAVLVGSYLAEKSSVIIIDADQEPRILEWFEAEGDKPAGLSVRRSDGEANIQDEIERAASEAAFVLVDLEGVASRMATFAMTESDLVVVPAQERYLDIQDAMKTIAEVGRVSRQLRREVPAVVCLTRTREVGRGTDARENADELRSNKGVRVMDCELLERDAVGAVWSHATSLGRLTDPRGGRDRARENVAALVAELLEILRSNRAGEAA
ncbi:ParA family protein [Limimaricola litoreus]|uniref:ParA family protein n=1 Tax=Limimaricola litoreus TaxID=2955316 RepID=A0A9X2FM65_9RHOB|nr:ParA family protein [Limimaricola litoreus]MCP1167362.1 ParA family protein [Limimaricola litoreus]